MICFFVFCFNLQSSAQTVTIPKIISPAPSTFSKPIPICSSRITLKGNKPNFSIGEKGFWENASTGSVNFLLPETNDSIVIELFQNGRYTFLWHIADSSGNEENPAAVYLMNFTTSKPIIQGSYELCEDSTILEAVPPTNGVGKWKSSVPGIAFTDSLKPTTEAKKIPRGLSEIYWEISSKDCPTKRDTALLNNLSATKPNAGISRSVCTDTVFLKANKPAQNETGKWLKHIENNANIDSIDNNRTIAKLLVGRNVFNWTIQNSNCGTSDTVTIIYTKPNTAKIITPNSTVCLNQIELNAELLPGSKGKWTSLPDNTFLSSLAKDNFNLKAGENIFRWTLENPTCGSSSADVTIKYEAISTPITAKDTCFIFDRQRDVKLRIRNTLEPGEYGIWTYLSTQGGIDFRKDTATASALFTPPKPGYYPFSIHLRKNDPVCKNSVFSNYTFLTKAELPQGPRCIPVKDSLLSDSVMAVHIPNKTEGEVGKWRVIPSKASARFKIDTTKAGKLYLRNFETGKYKIIWSVTNTNCTTCSNSCPNSDTIDISIIKKAVISNYGDSTCTNDSRLSLNGIIEKDKDEIGIWSSIDSVSFLPKKDTTSVLSGNFPIGRTSIKWEVRDKVFGCSSVDSLIVYRVTKPDAGSDACFASTTISANDNTILGTLKGTTPRSNEKSLWIYPDNSSIRFKETETNNTGILNSFPGNYKLRYRIYHATNRQCDNLSTDSVTVRFVSAPIPFVEKPYYLPLKQRITLTGLLAGVPNPSISSNTDTTYWVSTAVTAEILARGNKLTVPDSIKAGLYTYKFVVKSKTDACSFSAIDSVRVITSPKLTAPTCLKSDINTITINTNNIVNGEMATWHIKQYNKSKTYDNTAVGSRQFNLNPGEKTTFYRTVTAGKFTITDSIQITKLSTLTPQLKNTCAIGSEVALIPINPTQLRPYESAYWITSGLTNPGVKLKNAKSQNDTLLNLIPGQQIINLIIKDSTCMDTSKSSIAIVSISKPYAGADQCTTDTTKQLSTPAKISEKYTWFKGNIALSTVPNPNLKLELLENQFVLNIKSDLNANCNASDTIRITRITKAKSFADNCIKGADTIRLNGNPGSTAETKRWYKATSARDTLIASAHETTYKSLKQGINLFKYKITYGGCSDSSSFRAIMVKQADIVSDQTCLILPVSGKSSFTLKADPGMYDSTTTFKWSNDAGFIKDSIATNNSTNRFDLTESGKRLYRWTIRSKVFQTCFTQDSVRFTVIPKAVSTNESCVKSSNGQAPILLNGSRILASKGETGKWVSSPKALINDSTSSNTSATLVSKGNTTLKWIISNGICSDTATSTATHISKANILNNDSCIYYDALLKLPLRRNLIDTKYEQGVWTSRDSANIIPKNDSVIVSKLRKGIHTFYWKVTDNKNGSCTDSDSVRIALLTPFPKTSDILYTCTADTFITIPKLSPLDSVTRQFIAGKKVTNLFAQDTLKFPTLSNDTVYIYRRTIRPDSILTCSLSTDLRIINRQIEPIKFSFDSISTCGQGFTIKVNKPSSDIISAVGGWDRSKFELPLDQNNNNNFLLEESKTQPDKDSISYVASLMANVGRYKLTWQSSNLNCPALTDSVIIVKKPDLQTLFRTFEVCNENAFSFSKLESNYILKNADNVKWTPENPNSPILISNSTSNNKDSVVARGIPYGVHPIKYTASLGGCVSNTTIIIINHQPFSLDFNKERRSFDFCERDTFSLLVTHPISLFDTTHFSIDFSYDSLFRNNLNQSIKFVNKDSSKIFLRGLDDYNRIFIRARNGKLCQYQKDFVTIFNSSQPDSIKAGTDDTLCVKNISLNGQIYGLGKGSWSTYNGKPLNTLNGFATVPAISDTINSFVWTVKNGACTKSARVNYFIGDILPHDTVSNKFLSICDSSAFHLKAKPISGKGVWLFRQDSLPVGNQNVFNYLFNVDSRLIDKNNQAFVKADFVWKVYNKYCFNTDTMHVTYYRAPTQADAGENQSIVKENTTLAANNPQFGKGKWSILKGTSQIDDLTNFQANVKQLSAGENILAWTITNGTCPASSDQVVINYSEFNIPSGFSPNGDNKNDRFEIKGIENYPDTKLKVFNRWGTLVYSSTDYKNDWDGDGLSDDTYFYELVVPGSKDKHGYILLKRK